MAIPTASPCVTGGRKRTDGTALRRADSNKNGSDPETDNQQQEADNS